MELQSIKQPDGTTVIVAASIATEDVLVRSTVGYVPQYVTDVYGKTRRVTKDVTIAKLLRIMRKDFPDHELVSIGTPVNWDLAPSHLTRVEMRFQTEDQVVRCMKEISVSDMMIRSRLQPAWEWTCIYRFDLDIMLHVAWYDTVYFIQFKDIFIGEPHCRYSAKFDFDPRQAKITHFRYNEKGDLEELGELNRQEQHAESIKNDVEFLRVFRDGTMETT